MGFTDLLDQQNMLNKKNLRFESIRCGQSQDRGKRGKEDLSIRMGENDPGSVFRDHLI